MSPTIHIGGLQAFSSIDYPGELAAVVFLQGCPWRCGYCHNPELQSRQAEVYMDWPQLEAFLQQRRGLLDAVVFSGGEPTLQPSLVQALQSIQAMGFKTGLHSAGCYPERLAAALPHLNWVGLDIKALPQDYPALTTTPRSGKAAWVSLQLLLASPSAHEIRITLDPSLFEQERLPRLLQALHQAGVNNLALQQLNPPPADPQGQQKAQLQRLLNDFSGQFSQLILRGP
ncbi:MAG: anaerobic ribonucleoside-triphosphate reductase activating protein [Gammaproteobacteria bacterium]|nr:anaerobic ribonucleoside-triphosphate reductase activating protein [Gammaproteobacteria bacterium]